MVLDMKDNEYIDKYFARTSTITNKMVAHGEKLEQITIVEKVSRSMSPKFNYVVYSIEESMSL